MNDTVTENPKKAYGALKPCASFAPMNVMSSVYRVFELGAKKYGKKNWRRQPVDASTYYNAALRHLNEFFEEGIDADPESHQHPLAHVIACCMIIMDGLQRGELKDDRENYEVLTGANQTVLPVSDLKRPTFDPTFDPRKSVSSTSNI